MKRICCVAMVLCIAGSHLGAEQPEVSVQPTPFQGKRAKTLADSRGGVHLLFMDHGNLYYSRKPAGGGDFSDPLRVNSIERSAAIGEMAIGKDGRVHVAFHGNISYVREKVEAENRKLAARDIRYTFHTYLDAGASAFIEQRNVSDEVWGFDGGCAIAADADGHVYLFAGGTTKQGGEQERQVFLWHSSDNGETFAGARPVGLGKGVCACCHLKAQMGSAGRLMLAYRVADGGVDRDSYLLVSTDRGQTFAATPLDKWKLRACPGSLYSFANHGDRTWVSWRNQDEIYFSNEEGIEHRHPEKSEQKRRAAVMAANPRGEILVAWTEGENFNRPHDLCWQLWAADGKPMGTVKRKRNVFERWGSAAVYVEEDGDFVIFH